MYKLRALLTLYLLLAFTSANAVDPVFVGSETNSANSADSIVVDVHGDVEDGDVGLAYYSWS
ncbi:MAG: hypothetical protein GY938_20620, partial [Ketobacter sp.]|nr:hypothetical protein [Ketobacter sp.]